jgi:hypothetical protein
MTYSVVFAVCSPQGVQVGHDGDVALDAHLRRRIDDGVERHAFDRDRVVSNPTFSTGGDLEGKSELDQWQRASGLHYNGIGG